MDIDERFLDGLSDELKKKAVSCKTKEELVALAKEEGIKLTDGFLDGISGGSLWCLDCDE